MNKSLEPGAPACPARLRRFFAAAATVVILVAVSLALIEGAVRWLRPELAVSPVQVLASSRYHHVMPPNLRMYGGCIKGKKVFITTNEDGFRTRYSRATFRRHAVRVAVLGDSFAYGHGIVEDRMFTAWLEKKLRAQGADAAVLNAAEKGYSPLLERRRCEDLLTFYEPTVVVILLDATDIGDDWKYESELIPTVQGESIFPFGDDRPQASPGALGSAWVRIRQKLIPVLRRLWSSQKRYNYYAFRVPVEGGTESNRFFIYRHSLEATRPYFDRTFRHVNAIAERCASMGAQLFVFVTPRYQHWNARECPRNWETNDYAVPEPYQDEYFKYFDEKKGSVNYPIINMLPFYKATDRFPLVFDTDPHWNEQGSEFAAEVVARQLQQHSRPGRGGKTAAQAGEVK